MTGHHLPNVQGKTTINGPIMIEDNEDGEKSPRSHISSYDSSNYDRDKKESALRNKFFQAPPSEGMTVVGTGKKPISIMDTAVQPSSSSSDAVTTV